MRGSLASAWLLGSLVACVEEDGGSRGEPEVLLPEPLRLQWADSFNDVDDGLVGLVPVDVMVYDRASGRPLEGVEVYLDVPSPGARVVDPLQVATLRGLTCEACNATWDSFRDRFVWIAGSEDPILGARWFRTDEAGIVRAYVLVDAFLPSDRPSDYEPIEVLVTRGARTESFLVVAD
jgi:hypothetical protein